MKTEILKMLRETGDYVSGQEICEKFGVSRTAVWKVIRQLQEEGYQVEAVRSKGYRILDEPDVITAEESGKPDGDGMGRKACGLLSGNRLDKHQNPASGG